jgi:hypothetical protein
MKLNNTIVVKTAHITYAEESPFYGKRLVQACAFNGLIDSRAAVIGMFFSHPV